MLETTFRNVNHLYILQKVKVPKLIIDRGIPLRTEIHLELTRYPFFWTLRVSYCLKMPLSDLLGLGVNNILLVYATICDVRLYQRLF